ncbi:hypothetical protein [Streptosporangium sandarakinum]|uniref:hypothetical protein n=1 Tax=Streptosporangium sandarakinum TaxID=1260955 RepID=UPI0034204591
MAQSIGSDTTLGALILYLTPAASFVIGSALYYMQVQASRYMERRLVKNAMKTLQAQLDNPLTSEEHKARIRKLLEEAERHVANAEVQRIKQLGQPQYQQGGPS